MVAVEKVATMVGGAVAAAVGMEMVGRMAEAMVDAMMEEVRVRGPPAAWTMEAGREAGQWAGQKVELESAALLGNQSQSPVWPRSSTRGLRTKLPWPPRPMLFSVTPSLETVHHQLKSVLRPTFLVVSATAFQTKSGATLVEEPLPRFQRLRYLSNHWTTRAQAVTVEPTPVE